jgi:hypothetical protein
VGQPPPAVRPSKARRIRGWGKGPTFRKEREKWGTHANDSLTFLEVKDFDRKVRGVKQELAKEQDGGRFSLLHDRHFV